MDGMGYFAVCIPSWLEASDFRGLRAERQHTERYFDGINGVSVGAAVIEYGDPVLKRDRCIWRCLTSTRARRASPASGT